MNDQHHYLAAEEEVTQNRPDPALMAKARVLANGDDRGTRFKYIELRVEQLKKAELRDGVEVATGRLRNATKTPKVIAAWVGLFWGVFGLFIFFDDSHISFKDFLGLVFVFFIPAGLSIRLLYRVASGSAERGTAISAKYAEVQRMANDLSDAEALVAYRSALMSLAYALDNPLDPVMARFQRTAYVECVVALYERIRGRRTSEEGFPRNKGQFRMDVTNFVVNAQPGSGVFAICKGLEELFPVAAPAAVDKQTEDRVADTVQRMIEAGP